MTFTLLVSANYHQAADCLPAEARGRQCVPCSIIFLLMAKYIKPPAQMQRDDLHSILDAGSQLYCAMRSIQLLTTDFVDPENLPKRIHYQNKKATVVHKGVMSGVVGYPQGLQENGEHLSSLESAFLNSCSRSQYLIAVFAGVAIGIYYDGTSFVVFDSHSRSKNGRSCADGTAVLGSVGSLEGLCSYIRCLVDSMGIGQCLVQFDLHCFSFLAALDSDTKYAVEIFFPEFGFKIVNIRRKRTRSDVNGPCQDMENMMVGRSFLSVADDDSISPEESKVISQFHELVSVGPDYVCSCCTQTFFRHYVRSSEGLMVEVKQRFLSNFRSVDRCEWVCLGCWKPLKKGKTPQFWLHNGLNFPPKPDELQLSSLEERLVSPRLPFMQLREMPRGGQLNMRGNVVNVPADVNSTIKALPRMMNENETIMLKLKRSLSYKHHVSFENIRPNKVFEAARWLVGNSRLFRSEGIVVNETWLQQPLEAFSVDDRSSSATEGSCLESTSVQTDDWTEDENFNDRLTGNLDTCLQPLDFREFNQVLCLAPGEKNSPLALFQDLHSEILSFPTIFCGQPRVDNAKRLVPLPYSSICKWELRNVDRRVAVCIPNIFYKLKKLQIKQIRDKVSLAVRKCKVQGQSLTVGKLLTPGFVDQLTMQNDGYRVLRTLRGSPPYWEQAKRDLFSMIRQIGKPTWFCSFSAAETKWEPLLKTLTKLVKGHDITLQEAKVLSWHETCKLIKSDPVTCARYFDHRIQVFIRDVLKHVSNPIGEIVDFFYRVEFQQRGSPHVHMLLWVRDAPIHGTNTDSAVVEFVDKYVTCSQDSSIPELINYQTHRHANTCRKRGKHVCRFNFPLFPMPETTVLYPLEASESCPDYVTKVDKITALLDELHKAEADVSFQDFLNKLDMDMTLYVTVVRSTLNRAKVFLKRCVSESRINSYNKLLIKSWLANMDLQYVLDAYSCVQYIVSYISKGQRGLSNLLRDACTEAQTHDTGIKQQVRRIGNQFLSSVEIGAQEAVYLVLQMPLRRSTREVLFVDTKKADERTSLIKPYELLKNLPSDSCDVEMDNLLKRYKRRPKSMEMLCYADFAAWYDLCHGKKEKVVALENGELPEAEYELDNSDDVEPCGSISYENTIRFPCGTRMRKRRRQKVLYTHITPVNQDREEHFRQNLMLYSRWRNEDTDILSGFATFEESYHSKLDEVHANKLQYEKCAVDDYLHLQDDTDTEILTAGVNSESQHLDQVDADEGCHRSVEFSCFDAGAGANSVENYDIGEDIGVSKRSLGAEILPQKEIDNEQYLQQVRALNREQKEFFYHILFKVKTESLPFYTFLSGGAGVGKSVVTRCIYQSLLKYWNHRRDENPDAFKLLLCAPTGKAAHNIGGMTIHSAFCIPANQGFHFKPLDMQQLNTMRARYHSLKVVIIDEISMVGRNMFNFINLRLQEIMGCTKPFGNVSVLAVGDLFQLKPVMDSWVFSQTFSSPQMSCLAPSLWVELFDFYELKEVMRQKDDRSFAELLNRLREGLHTDEDLHVLQSRKVDEAESRTLQSLPHLFCRRQDSVSHNLAVLQGLPLSDSITIEAIDDVSGDVSPFVRDNILSRIPSDASLTMGLHNRLTLGIGLPGEICVNVDTEDGLTNGASCYIKKFDFRVSDSRRCSIVWVEFEDKSVGMKWRKQYKHLYTDTIPLTWTPVLEINRRFTLRYSKTYLVVRRQFPVCLSAGKTIHKAQGSTLTAAVLHFGKRKIDHIHYVGLSRVTSLSQVHITELNSAKISVSLEVEAEMERLRSEKAISCAPLLLESRRHDVMKVCFHNCRSLQKHFEDFKHDCYLQSADIIGFAEARLWEMLDAKYSVQGFHVIAASQEESAHGLVIYYRSTLSLDRLCFNTILGIEYGLVGMNHDTVIGFVYCPPRKATVATLTQFLSAVSAAVSQYVPASLSVKLVLMGDFNFECMGNKSFSQIFRNKFSLHQLVKGVTSDYGTCIDHVYSNLDENNVVACGTLESYYSDHKPVCLAFSLPV